MKNICVEIDFELSDSEPVKKEKQQNDKRICKFCNKSLKSIGMNRKNGGDKFYDGANRNYHIKCYKKNCKDNRLLEHANKMLIHGSLYDMFN